MLKSIIPALALHILWAFSICAAPPTPSSGMDELYGQGVSALDRHDYDLAFEILLPLAEAGHSHAQSRIAHMYYWGEGREPDYVRHFEWSLRSAQSGNPIGQFDVATDYFTGRGVANDNKAGLKWTLLAADGGDEYAQFALAVRFLGGFDVPANEERGIYYLQLALEKNEPRALAFAGANHLLGEMGFDRDLGKGHELISRAAEHRHAGAQLVHGLYLLELAESAEDSASAVKWLILSEKAGCERAAEHMTRLRAWLNSETIAMAAGLAEDWTAQVPPRAPHDHRDYKANCNIDPILTARWDVTPQHVAPEGVFSHL